MNEIKEKFTVIPAAPGWYSIDMDTGDGSPELILDPIIAWLITYGGDTDGGGEAFVRPVTAYGTPEDGCHMTQSPDGLFTDCFGSHYYSKEDVMAEFQERIDVMNKKGLAASKGQ